MNDDKYFREYNRENLTGTIQEAFNLLHIAMLHLWATAIPSDDFRKLRNRKVKELQAFRKEWLQWKINPDGKN